MKFSPLHLLAVSLCLSLTALPVVAQDWRDGMKDLVYSPRYFAANAFPIPELRSGKVGTRYEVEIRGEYQYHTGDKIKDLYARAYLPFVKGRAGMEVSLVIHEEFETEEATRVERHAAYGPNTCRGDVILNAFFQVLKSEKWVDALFSFNLKTASGTRLAQARYTDGASYWVDLTVGKDLFHSKDRHFSLRAQAMGGFYCWMTNDMVHRQNDAISFGGGLTAIYRAFTLSSDISGFYGYKDNGDQPLIWRNVLNYELKKNILSARYHHGMKDRLYDTYALAYIRCF